MVTAKTRGVLIIAAAILAPPTYAAFPASWHALYAPTNAALTAAAYGDRLVAVGRASTILVAYERWRWQQIAVDFGSDSDLLCVTYGKGIYVAGGSGNALLVTSENGYSWTNRMRTIGAQRINGVAFGNDRFVGVGAGALLPSSYLLSSTDGTNWVFPARPTANTLNAVAYGNGLFVAVGMAGTIVTSSDGLNWIVRSSGTQRHLRAVTWSGSIFIAGGDGAVTLISNEGISWSPGAPPAFEVTGLAAGDGAVVGVGNFQGSGRYHVSPDGIVWPGEVLSAAQALNSVAYLNGHFIALGNNGLILQSDLSTEGAVNFWTKRTSGYWEEPYWSLNELPALKHGSIYIDNAGWKAVAIGSGTTLNYPDTLRIANLVVQATDTNSANLLLLNWAGLSVPLDITNDFRILPRCGLLSYASAVKASNFYLDGNATFAEQSQAHFDHLSMGIWWDLFGGGAPPELVISNANVSIGTVEMLQTTGRIAQYSGSSSIGSLMIQQNASTYTLFDGTSLIASNATLFGYSYVGASPARAKMLVTGGTAKCGGTLSLGRALTGWGDFQISGGSFESRVVSIQEGSFNQSGGSSAVGDMILPEFGVDANVMLSGGTLSSGYISLGRQYNSSWRGYGTFIQSGGVHVNTNVVQLLGEIRRQQSYGTGRYILMGGDFISPLLDVPGGYFELSNGTIRVSQLHLDSFGRCRLSGGRSEIDNVLIGEGYTTGLPYRSYLDIDNGTHTIKDTLQVVSWGGVGLFQGTLYVSNIVLAGNSSVGAGAANIFQSGTLTFAGGTLGVGVGTNNFGYLRVGGGVLVMPSGFPCILRFKDSRNVPWDSGGSLVIKGWDGSYTGGGSMRIYVGSSAQALTPTQLAQIKFSNAGFPARILPTGEIVPAVGPSITYKRIPNGFALSYPQGYNLLTSTNVTGPYTWAWLPDNPYTNTFSDPRRFFILYTAP